MAEEAEMKLVLLKNKVETIKKYLYPLDVSISKDNNVLCIGGFIKKVGFELSYDYIMSLTDDSEKLEKQMKMIVNKMEHDFFKISKTFVVPEESKKLMTINKVDFEVVLQTDIEKPILLLPITENVKLIEKFGLKLPGDDM